jgi:hypothetical protein
MHLFAASNCHFYVILLVCLALWRASAHGQSAEAVVQSEIVKPNANVPKQPQPLRRDEIPKPPPWVYPDAIPHPPSCVLEGGDCGWNSSSIAKCSADKCVLTLFGGCVNDATLVDKSCLCASLSSSKCHNQCPSMKWAEYLHWLSNTCGDLSNWHGLPDGWLEEAQEAANAVLINVGHRTELIEFDYVYGYTDTYLPTYQIPPTINNTCPSMWLGRWNSSLYNLTEVQLVQGTDIGYDDFDVEEPLYLDQLGFCNNSYDTLPTGCDSGILRSELLTWMTLICKEPTKYGWPSNWRDSLLVLNSTYVEKDSLDSSRPSCFNGQYECHTPLSQTEADCSSTRCVIDSAGNCSAPTAAVDRQCYCKNSMHLWKPTLNEELLIFRS